jgi:hypothetical protein
MGFLPEGIGEKRFFPEKDAKSGFLRVYILWRLRGESLTGVRTQRRKTPMRC